MKVIYKYLIKFKEPLYISLVLISIIIILKLLKRNLVEGHTEHSYVSHSVTAEKGCEDDYGWEFSDLNELLKKLENIQIKRYDINLYKQTFQEMIISDDFGWTNELVMAYLDSEHADGPEYQLIQKKHGLYDLILDYAHHYEDKKATLTSSGKWAKIEDSALLPYPNEIMQIMTAAELDIGYILFESFKKGSPDFKKIMTEGSYIKLFKKNKIKNWSKRNKTHNLNKSPWEDNNGWITSSYEKYSNSTSGKGSSSSSGCLFISGEDECQICDKTEQIACWKKKWLEYQNKYNASSVEYEKLKTEYAILEEKSLTANNYNTEINKIQAEQKNRVLSCNSLMGYGEAGMDDVSNEQAAEKTGFEWCSIKTDNDGNTCQFNKVKRSPKKIRKKGGPQYQIFCKV